jgi:soluble cytochrome b562
MKNCSAFTWFLVFPILSPVVSAADTPAAASPAAPATASETEKKTELEMRMDRIGKAFRKLKKQAADPAQNAASLQLLSTMEGAAKEAVDFTPAKAADVPEDQRAKFVEDFKTGIRGMLDEFAKLRVALAAGKNDEAVKVVDEISDLEKKDHKEFRRPEKE